jgi:hypothetical protein
MKRFVPLFESFNHNEIVTDIIEKIANAIEEVGFFEFVQVANGTINISRSENVDWDTFYVRDESVRMYSEYSATLTPVLEDDIDDLVSLYDVGLTNISGIIKGFNVASSVTYDSKDCDFYHEVGDSKDEAFITFSDFGINDGDPLDEMGDAISDWLKEDWYGLTYGLNLQDLLDGQYPEYEEDENENDEAEEDED